MKLLDSLLSNHKTERSSTDIMGYTLGWMIEVFYEPGPAYGPKMFKVGLKLTLCIVLLPALLNVIQESKAAYHNVLKKLNICKAHNFIINKYYI